MNLNLNKFLFCLIPTLMIFFFSALAQENDLQEIDSIISNPNIKLLYSSQHLPKDLCKTLNSKSGEKVKFSSVKQDFKKRKIKSRVLLFAIKLENRWIIYYGHGSRAVHRHLIYAQFDAHGRITYYSNYIYMGIENTFDEVKKKASEKNISIRKVDEESDI